MLPTKPQTIMNVFFDSIKACKKIYVQMLPICALIFITEASSVFFKSPQAFCLLSPLSMFCMYYGLYFAYNKPIQSELDHKTAIIITITRFFQSFVAFISFFACYLAMLLIMITSLIIISELIVEFFGYSLFQLQSAEQTYMMLLMLITILVILASLFASFASMDVLLKNSSIFAAVKKMLRIAFKIDNIWRVVVIFILPISVILLPNVLNYLHLITVNTSILILALIGAIYLPLSSTTSIYVYHDLMLRFEQRNGT